MLARWTRVFRVLRDLLAFVAAAQWLLVSAFGGELPRQTLANDTIDPSRPFFHFGFGGRIHDDSPWWSHRTPCVQRNEDLAEDFETAQQRTIECLEGKLEQARRAGNLELEVLLLNDLARVHFEMRGFDRADELTERALILVGGFRNPCWKSFELIKRGQFMHSTIDERRLMREAVSTAAEGGCHLEHAFALYELAMDENSGSNAQLETLEAALTSARVDEDPRLMTLILCQAVSIYAKRRDPQAVLYAQENVDLYRSTGDQSNLFLAEWNLGIAHELLGSVPEAIPHLQRLVDHIEERGLHNSGESRHLEWLKSR